MSSANTRFDSVKAEAFANGFLATLNHGALCLMASIERPAKQHRCGEGRRAALSSV
jgi:hypothetical protein